MKLVIEIPEEVKKTFDNASKADIYETPYYDFNSVIGRAIQNGKPLGKCDRCGCDIDINTLCVDCNDRLVRQVFAEKIKQEIRAEIEKAMNDYYYSEHDLGVRQGFRFALEIIDNHIGEVSRCK